MKHFIIDGSAVFAIIALTLFSLNIPTSNVEASSNAATLDTSDDSIEVSHSDAIRKVRINDKLHHFSVAITKIDKKSATRLFIKNHINLFDIIEKTNAVGWFMENSQALKAGRKRITEHGLPWLRIDSWKQIPSPIKASLEYSGILTSSVNPFAVHVGRKTIIWRRFCWKKKLTNGMHALMVT